MTPLRVDFGGAWPDVCRDDVVYAHGRDVVALRVHPSRELETLWVVTLDEPAMFVRCAVDPQSGEVAAVGKGNATGAAILIRGGRGTVIGTTAGNCPCAIFHNGTEFVVRWVERPDTLATLFTANGQHVTEPIAPASDGQYSSTGILDLGADGSVIWVDQRRAIQVGAWTFTEPNMRAGVIVGQTDPPAIRVAVGDRVFSALTDQMGESPRLSVLDNGRILVTAYTSRGASLAIIDPPYPDPEVPPVSVPAIGRALWAGFFRFGSAPSDAPGNCELPVDADMLVRDRAGAIVAQYVDAEAAGPSLPNLEAAIAAARGRRPSVQVIAYWPEGLQGGAVPSADLVGVEAYQNLTESLTAFEARVRAAVARCRTAVLIAQAYTSNASQTTDLTSLVPVYARIARDCPPARGILAFSAGSRPTGWDAHPEIHDAWRQLAAGIPSAPPIVVIAPHTPTPAPKPAPRPPAPRPVPVPLPDPEGDLLMFATFIDPQKSLITAQSVKSIAGTPLSVLVLPGGRVFSCQPDGRAEDRDADADGGYERCRVAGNVATFQPVAGKFYSFGFVVVEGL